jgi:hypothetical protein
MVGRVIAEFVSAPTSAIPRPAGEPSGHDFHGGSGNIFLTRTFREMTRGPDHSHLKAWTATVQAGALQRLEPFDGAATPMNCDASRYMASHARLGF